MCIDQHRRSVGRYWRIVMWADLSAGVNARRTSSPGHARPLVRESGRPRARTWRPTLHTTYTHQWNSVPNSWNWPPKTAKNAHTHTDVGSTLEPLAFPNLNKNTGSPRQRAVMERFNVLYMFVIEWVRILFFLGSGTPHIRRQECVMQQREGSPPQAPSQFYEWTFVVRRLQLKQIIIQRELIVTIVKWSVLIFLVYIFCVWVLPDRWK